MEKETAVVSSIEYEVIICIPLPDILSAPNILKISSSRDKKNLVPPEIKEWIEESINKGMKSLCMCVFV